MSDVQKYIKSKSDDLMSREVNRAEFLRYTGVALLSIVGVNSFLKNLHDNVPGRKNTNRVAKTGYGRGGYGV